MAMAAESALSSGTFPPQRRAFTMPARLQQRPSAPTTDHVDAEGVETLFAHPSAKIVTFQVPAAMKIGANAAAAAKVVGTLPWASRSERVISVGPLRIYRVPGSVAFLNSGELLLSLLPRSQCWCVDGQSKFCMKVQQLIYRIELPYSTEEDKQKVGDMTVALKEIIQYEKTACPFKRGFTVELPEEQDSPIKRVLVGPKLTSRKRGDYTSPAKSQDVRPQTPDRSPASTPGLSDDDSHSNSVNTNAPVSSTHDVGFSTETPSRIKTPSAMKVRPIVLDFETTEAQAALQRRKEQPLSIASTTGPSSELDSSVVIGEIPTEPFGNHETGFPKLIGSSPSLDKQRKPGTNATCTVTEGTVEAAKKNSSLQPGLSSPPEPQIAELEVAKPQLIQDHGMGTESTTSMDVSNMTHNIAKLGQSSDRQGINGFQTHTGEASASTVVFNQSTSPRSRTPETEPEETGTSTMATTAETETIGLHQTRHSSSLEPIPERPVRTMSSRHVLHRTHSAQLFSQSGSSEDLASGLLSKSLALLMSPPSSLVTIMMQIANRIIASGAFQSSGQAWRVGLGQSSRMPGRWEDTDEECSDEGDGRFSGAEEKDDDIEIDDYGVPLGNEVLDRARRARWGAAQSEID